jgi:hypothetical protein
VRSLPPRPQKKKTKGIWGSEVSPPPPASIDRYLIRQQQQRCETGKTDSPFPPFYSTESAARRLSRLCFVGGVRWGERIHRGKFPQDPNTAWGVKETEKHFHRHKQTNKQPTKQQNNKKMISPAAAAAEIISPPLSSVLGVSLFVVHPPHDDREKK